jgi:Mor family transcriptional regulator
MRLFDYDPAIAEVFDSETGEILDEQRLNELLMERDQKIENIALYIKELSSEVDALKKESQNLLHRKSVKEHKIDSLKRYLSSYMDGQKFESPKAVVSYRKSNSVKIYNEDALPAEFWKCTYDVDKAKIKEVIKGGAEVPGAEIVTNNNIQIK